MTMNKQKILLLDNGKEWGGGTNSMLELLKRIDRQKFDITCCFYHNYTRGNGETIESILNSLDIQVFFIPQIKQPRWAKIVKEATRTLLFFNRKLRKRLIDLIDERWRIAPNALKINSLLQLGNYDTLYMNNQPSTNVEGYIAARGLDVAVVQHCRIDPLMDARLVKIVNHDCQAVIAVSHGVNKTLCNSGVLAERCFTVSNAIDIHQPLPDRLEVRQRFKLSPDTFVFGSIGSLILRKSNHHILQALGRFKRANPDADWKMVIVGAGPELQPLLQLATAENIQNQVIFTGFQNNALEYLTAFDTFILASRSEGLPRVVLEAMLVNTAVVGSRVVGTAELISHDETGLLFDYGNVVQLTQHLTALWQDNELRQRLVVAAAKRVREQYAIESYVNGVENILQSVVREKQHA
ncbi:glycosyltransferase [Pantoea sp. LMR881]|uniref:glycosyltransferase n=1 Tax=Pantoea sp. LMR881 TaxID=3014336 RepID=UPI0022AF3E4E|nr:glycosyltransferase [Pantoea sp. LMR881]MCZ4059802.1 glycosyltransferase [Pantoea sp. LMR881]